METLTLEHSPLPWAISQENSRIMSCAYLAKIDHATLKAPSNGESVKHVMKSDIVAIFADSRRHRKDMEFVLTAVNNFYEMLFFLKIIRDTNGPLTPFGLSQLDKLIQDIEPTKATY